MFSNCNNRQIVVTAECARLWTFPAHVWQERLKTNTGQYCCRRSCFLYRTCTPIPCSILCLLQAEPDERPDVWRQLQEGIAYEQRFEGEEAGEEEEEEGEEGEEDTP